MGRRQLLSLLPSVALSAGLGSLSGCRRQHDNVIEIRGSDSEVNLVQRFAETFMAKHLDVSVAVTGGGSGTGIAALLDGTIGLANSSRDLKAGEKLLALRKGVKPVANLFATDALSVIVHEDSPLEALTVAEVGALFSGATKRWDGLGGSGDVIGYGRQSSSGTYGFFRDEVVKGPFSPQVREMNGNAQIVEGVARDPGGIGYVAVGYVRQGARGVRPLSIRAGEGEDAVSPLDAAAVRKGRYPIARPLYQFTNGVPTGAVRDFILFELSKDGEQLASEMGFYPLVDAWRERNAHLYASGEPGTV